MLSFRTVGMLVFVGMSTTRVVPAVAGRFVFERGTLAPAAFQPIGVKWNILSNHQIFYLR